MIKVWRDEKGLALGITLLMAIVLTIIGGIGLYLISHEARSSRASRLSTIALKAAEAGVERALTRLKNGTVEDFTGTTGGASYSVDVEPEDTNATTYTVTSVGTFKGVSRTVKVVTTKEVTGGIFGYSFFAKKVLDLSGSTVALSVKNKDDYVSLLQADANGEIDLTTGNFEEISNFLGYLPYVKVGAGETIETSGSLNVGFDPANLDLDFTPDPNESYRNGYLESEGDIEIKGSGNYGYVRAAGSVSVSGSAGVYSTEEGADISFPDLPPVNFDGQESVVQSAPDITGSGTIGPGAYGDVDLSGSSVLTLSGSGTYYFNSIHVSSRNATIKVDTTEGPVTIKVLDEFKLTGGGGGIEGADLDVDTPDRILVELAVQDPEDKPNSTSVDITGGAIVHAAIYAPQANVRVCGGNTMVIGSIVAQNIRRTGSGLWLYYEPLADFGGVGPVEVRMKIERWVVD